MGPQVLLPLSWDKMVWEYILAPSPHERFRGNLSSLVFVQAKKAI